MTVVNVLQMSSVCVCVYFGGSLGSCMHVCVALH